jgi:amidase
VAATAAFTHRPAWSAVDIDGRSYPYGVANGAYTMPFNVSGHPAIVIPIGQTQDGLPMGVQIVGKRWREMELLAIAQQLDQILGAFQHPPISQPKNMLSTTVQQTESNTIRPKVPDTAIT